jgi:sulfur-oxidizing protein SoxZ
MANVMVNAPKTARKGEVVQIKAIVLHPMETGYRVGTNGQMIPRNIIERFTATWNGEEIFDMKFSPAIAANPFVTFFATASESGKIGLRWKGDNDFDVEHSVDIAVE